MISHFFFFYSQHLSLGSVETSSHPDSQVTESHSPFVLITKARHIVKNQTIQGKNKEESKNLSCKPNPER